MTAPSVDSAVMSTTSIAPIRAVKPRIRTGSNHELASMAPGEPASALVIELMVETIDSNTPRPLSTLYRTATATKRMTKDTRDSTKLNFMADHGSMRRSTRCAWRGPRAEPDCFLGRVVEEGVSTCTPPPPFIMPGAAPPSTAVSPGGGGLDVPPEPLTGRGAGRVGPAVPLSDAGGLASTDASWGEACPSPRGGVCWSPELWACLSPGA